MKINTNIPQDRGLCQRVFLGQMNALRGCRTYSVYGEEIFCIHWSKSALFLQLEFG